MCHVSQLSTDMLLIQCFSVSEPAMWVTNQFHVGYAEPSSAAIGFVELKNTRNRVTGQGRILLGERKKGRMLCLEYVGRWGACSGISKRCGVQPAPGGAY